MSDNAENSFQLEMGTISKLFDICGYENSRLSVETEPNLLGRSIFGHGFGAFRDGVLGQLSGQEETDRSLDLARGDGGPLVVVSQATSLGGDALDERVRHGRRLGRAPAGQCAWGVEPA